MVIAMICYREIMRMCVFNNIRVLFYSVTLKKERRFTSILYKQINQATRCFRAGAIIKRKCHCFHFCLK